MAGGTVTKPQLRTISFADERKSREAVLAGERNTESLHSVNERSDAGKYFDKAILCFVRAREFDEIKNVLRAAPAQVIAHTLSQIASMGRLDVLAEIAQMKETAPHAAEAARKKLAGLTLKDIQEIGWRNMEYCGGSPVREKAVQASLEAAGIYGGEEAGKAAFDYALASYMKTGDPGFLLTMVNIAKSSENGQVRHYGADRLIEHGNMYALDELRASGGETGDYVKATIARNKVRESLPHIFEEHSCLRED